jgi:transposase
MHFHADLLAALPPQITLLPLPTYAPWSNPVEKVWHWLYAEVLHLPEFTDGWPELWDLVDAWLAQ